MNDDKKSTIKVEVEGEIKRVAVSDLLQPPIRHETLSPKILEDIKLIHDTIGHYVDNKTLEEWEISFMRETNPDQEIAVWNRIICAWKQYHILFLTDELGTHEFESAIICTLLGISMDAEPLNAPPHIEQQLRQCWANPWRGDGK